MRVRVWTVRSTVASVAILAFFAAPSAMTAASASADFGRHVAECAQTHGFDGEHNPGMHQGRSGWSGTTC